MLVMDIHDLKDGKEYIRSLVLNIEENPKNAHNTRHTSVSA